jgi:hypothetical protein
MHLNSTASQHLEQVLKTFLLSFFDLFEDGKNETMQNGITG